MKLGVMNSSQFFPRTRLTQKAASSLWSASSHPLPLHPTHCNVKYNKPTCYFSHRLCSPPNSVQHSNSPWNIVHPPLLSTQALILLFHLFVRSCPSLFSPKGPLLVPLHLMHILLFILPILLAWEEVNIKQHRYSFLAYCGKLWIIPAQHLLSLLLLLLLLFSAIPPCHDQRTAFKTASSSYLCI